MLELILIFDIVVLFLIIVLFNKELLKLIDRICYNLRNFVYRNDSFFTILFLLLFFIEQVILLIFVFYYRENISAIQIIVSGFGLIVVTTASLQKAILEVRVRHFKEQAIAVHRLTYFVERILSALKKK